MVEKLQIGLFLAAMCLAVMSVASFVLHYFIALKSTPPKRAAWTAGLAYLGTTLAFIFGGVEGYELIAPIAALPAGLIVFWYWRMDFRKSWVDDPELLPEGANLSNDDWRIGVAIVATVIVAAAFKVLLRGN